MRNDLGDAVEPARTSTVRFVEDDVAARVVVGESCGRRRAGPTRALPVREPRDDALL